MNAKKLTPISEHTPNAAKMDLELKINGVEYQVETAPTTRLVHILREELGLTGTKISCEIGRCGACAVEMNGKLVNSCLVMAYQANHASICTIEGLGHDDFHPIQQAFLEEGGFQCGYCTPGMIMAARALLIRNPVPSDAEIVEALSGNLCRCTGYGGIIRSVRKAVSLLKQKE